MAEITILILGAIGGLLWFVLLFLSEDVPTDIAHWVVPRISRLVLRVASFGRVRRAPVVEWVVGLVLLVAIGTSILIVGARILNPAP